MCCRSSSENWACANADTASALVEASLLCGKPHVGAAVVKKFQASSLFPSRRVFNRLIRGLGERGLLEQAFAVCDTLVLAGGQADEETLGHLMSACISCDQVDRALELFSVSPKPS